MLDLVIVDHRKLISECLGISLHAIDPTITITYASNLTEIEQPLSRDQSPDLSPNSSPKPRVILLAASDPKTPNAPNVPNTLRENISKIKESDSTAHIAVLSESDEVNIAEIIGYGASGYISSNTKLSVVLCAIRLIAVGGLYLPASILDQYRKGDTQPAQSVAEPSAKHEFTTRQRQVMEGLRQGKPNKIIAYELTMCESTVKVHARTIMKKLSAKNRAEVAYILSKNKIVYEPPLKHAPRQEQAAE